MSTTLSTSPIRYNGALLLSFNILLALLLDRLLGEPTRLHPLVGFGRLAQGVERRLIADGQSRMRGVLAVVLLIGIVLLPLLISLHYLIAWMPQLQWPLAIVALYLAIGGRSLAQHAERVGEALVATNIDEARRRVAMIVSRDCEQLDDEGVARATVESVLENGSDAIFAPIFWFLVLGIPGVVLYRIVNTLDAMWGYRNERYLYFGWAAARLDDGLNWLPARLTALAYLLTGASRSAWQCWQKQGRQMASPNAGVVMAAGAGALQIKLGGAAQYHGKWIDKPQLGFGAAATAKDIARASTLLNRATVLWLIVMAIIEWAIR